VVGHRADHRSKRIRQLERTLGEPLFTRGTPGVELTSAGHRFLPHARQLLDAVDAATQAARPASWPQRSSDPLASACWSPSHQNRTVWDG
jgi:DNA-binding transcriptional LysR family regulator